MVKRFGTDQDQPVELKFVIPVYSDGDDGGEIVEDEQFTRRRSIRPAVFSEMQKRVNEIREDKSVGLDELLAVQFDQLLVPESAARMRDLLTSEDRVADMRAVNESLMWIMGEMTGDRPTMRPQPSPGGSAGTGDTSPVG